MMDKQNVSFVSDRGHKVDGSVTVGSKPARRLSKNSKMDSLPMVSASEPNECGNGIHIRVAATGPKVILIDVQSNKVAELERAAQGASDSDRERNTGGRIDPNRLNSSQKRLIEVISSHQVGDGFVAFSKRDLTDLLGRSGKTVDTVVANLRRRGLIEAKSRYAETGGQISSAYRVTDLAREKYPALFG